MFKQKIFLYKNLIQEFFNKLFFLNQEYDQEYNYSDIYFGDNTSKEGDGLVIYNHYLIPKFTI